MLWVANMTESSAGRGKLSPCSRDSPCQHSRARTFSQVHPSAQTEFPCSALCLSWGQKEQRDTTQVLGWYHSYHHKQAVFYRSPLQWGTSSHYRTRRPSSTPEHQWQQSCPLTWAVPKFWPGAMHLWTACWACRGLCRAHHGGPEPTGHVCWQITHLTLAQQQGCSYREPGSSSPATEHKPGDESNCSGGEGESEGRILSLSLERVQVSEDNATALA